MQVHTRSKNIDLTVDDNRRLEAEVAQLRVELTAERSECHELQCRLEAAAAMARVAADAALGASSERDVSATKYVFEDDDAVGAAFDEFFAAPDPDLARIRGFLLD